jgi:hypothetical protein
MHIALSLSSLESVNIFPNVFGLFRAHNFILFV